MNWTERGLHPQPWRIGHGCITADKEPSGGSPSEEDLRYYSGAFVCEGISDADAAFVMVAIRQRDLLLEVIPSLPHPQQAAVRRLLARVEEAIPLETFAAKAHAEMLRKMRWPYTLPALPEFASRARTEIYAEVFVPSGQFVTDDIELSWQLRAGSDPTGFFYDYELCGAKWQKTNDIPF